VSKAYCRLLKNRDSFEKRTLRIPIHKYRWGRRVRNLLFIDSFLSAITLNSNAHVGESDPYLAFISESSIVEIYSSQAVGENFKVQLTFPPPIKLTGTGRMLEILPICF